MSPISGNQLLDVAASGSEKGVPLHLLSVGRSSLGGVLLEVRRNPSCGEQLVEVVPVPGDHGAFETVPDALAQLGRRHAVAEAGGR